MGQWERINYDHPRFDGCVRLKQYPVAHVPGKAVYWIIEDGRGRYAVRDAAPGSNGNEPCAYPELFIYDTDLTWNQALKLARSMPGCIPERPADEPAQVAYALKY